MKKSRPKVNNLLPRQLFVVLGFSRDRELSISENRCYPPNPVFAALEIKLVTRTDLATNPVSISKYTTIPRAANLGVWGSPREAKMIVGGQANGVPSPTTTVERFTVGTFWGHRLLTRIFPNREPEIEARRLTLDTLAALLHSGGTYHVTTHSPPCSSMAEFPHCS
jgi:hypothetical protein